MLWNQGGWNRMTQKTKFLLNRITRRPNNIGLLTILLVFCPLLSAQPLLLKESDLFIDLPTIKSASRLKQNPHTSPTSVSIINQQMIKASGAQTLTDILALAPGFQVFQLNANRQGANYHGVNDQFPNQLEIMVNGRSVYIPLLSTVLWHTLGIHIDDIDRVEIIRGSNSATHGSNAFLGAVNFITKSPMTDSKLKAYGNAGSMDTKSGHLSHSGQLGGTFYRISASSVTNSGSKRFKDSHQRNYINTQWVWSPTIEDSINLSFGYDRGYSHIGYLYNYENRFPNGERYIAKQNYSSNFQHLSWLRNLNNNQILHINAYRNTLDLREARPTVDDITKFITGNQNIALEIIKSNPEFRGYREHGRTSLWDIETALESEINNLHSFTGIGIRNETSSSPVLLQSGDIKSEKIRLFNSNEIELSPNLTANTGLMYERKSSREYARSGRLSFNYQLLPQTSIRLGYSHSERLPSLLEKNVNYTIFPDRIIERKSKELSPEVIRSFEVGVYHQLKNLHGTIDLRVFQENISNAIVNYKSDSIGERRNIGEWKNRGFETQLKINPTNNINVLFNYSYLLNSVKPWNQGSEGYMQGGQHAPRHTLSTLMNVEVLPNINLSTSYYFLDDILWRRSYNVLQQPKYQRLDIRLAKVWTGPHHQIELAAIIKNALNERYQTFYQDHQFDRKTFFQLNITMD